MDSTLDGDTLLLSVVEQFDYDDEEDEDKLDELASSQPRSHRTPRGSVTRLHLTPVSLSLTASALTHKEESSMDIRTISEEKDGEVDAHGAYTQSQSHSRSKSKSKSYSYSSDDFDSASISQSNFDERLIRRKLQVLKRNEREGFSETKAKDANKSTEIPAELQKLCKRKLDTLKKNLSQNKGATTGDKRPAVASATLDPLPKRVEPLKAQIPHRVIERLKIEQCLFHMKSISSKMSKELDDYQAKLDEDAPRVAELQLEEFARRKARQIRQQLQSQNATESDFELQQARLADLHMREVGRMMRMATVLARAENAKLVWQKLLQPIL